MSYQSIFSRYELKYVITVKQKEQILQATREYMKLDDYGRTTIRNLYFDTDNYRLIRRSIEKPVYREKLRIRCYKKVDDEDQVFVELKKKHDSIVYKRRIALPYKEAYEWLCENHHINIKTQIVREIEYFKEYYETLKPLVYISYDREAYNAINERDFRVTFDENILWRQTDLSLKDKAYGNKIIDEGYVLMEIKTLEAIPLWMSHILTKEKIYKTPFSKYGHAYEEIISEID